MTKDASGKQLAKINPQQVVSLTICVEVWSYYRSCSIIYDRL